MTDFRDWTVYIEAKHDMSLTCCEKKGEGTEVFDGMGGLGSIDEIEYLITIRHVIQFGFDSKSNRRILCDHKQFSFHSVVASLTQSGTYKEHVPDGVEWIHEIEHQYCKDDGPAIIPTGRINTGAPMISESASLSGHKGHVWVPIDPDHNDGELASWEVDLGQPRLKLEAAYDLGADTTLRFPGSREGHSGAPIFSVEQNRLVAVFGSLIEPKDANDERQGLALAASCSRVRELIDRPEFKSQHRTLRDKARG